MDMIRVSKSTTRKEDDSSSESTDNTDGKEAVAEPLLNAATKKAIEIKLNRKSSFLSTFLIGLVPPNVTKRREISRAGRALRALETATEAAMSTETLCKTPRSTSTTIQVYTPTRSSESWEPDSPEEEALFETILATPIMTSPPRDPMPEPIDFTSPVRYFREHAVSAPSLIPTPEDSTTQVRVQVRGIHYVLDKATLIKHSGYFRDRLREAWLESSQEIVDELDEVRTSGWLLFLAYLKKGDFGEVNMRRLNDPKLSTEEMEDYGDDYEGDDFAIGGLEEISWGPADLVIDRLITAYLLGRYLVASGFCNKIMDYLVEKYRHFTHLNGNKVPLWNQQVVNENVEGCGLQRFMVDVLAWFLSEKTFREALREGLLTNEIMTEVAFSSLRDKGRNLHYRGKDPLGRRACVYHDHPNGEYDSTCGDPGAGEAL